MLVKGNHPLAEILAKKLFSIETVPAKEQKRMVNRAINAGVEYHKAEIKKLENANETLSFQTSEFANSLNKSETDNKKLREALVNTNKIIKDSSEVGYPVNVVLRGQYEANQKILEDGK